MTFRSTRWLAALLASGVMASGVLGAAQAQVGGQAAPVLSNALFGGAARGPAGTYLLPGGVSVLLSQNQGFLMSGTVQVKYTAPAAQPAAAPATSTQGSGGPNSAVARVAQVIGVLSGYGEELAGPLEAFLNRPDVAAQLAQGFSVGAEEYLLSAKTEGGVLKVTLSLPQVDARAFQAVKTLRPARTPSARPVVVRVYSDFQCPYCQKFETETLPTLLAKLPDDVSVEFHHFPLEQIHPLARPSAEASECASQQGKFWAYKDALFTDRSWLASNPQEVFVRLAGKAGLNVAVDAGLQEALRLNLNGTPTVFVNGFRAANAYDANGLLNLIAFARVAGTLPTPAATPARP